MSVAIVEAEHLGGVCLNWGCIPTKAILSSAETFEAVRKNAVPGFIVDGLKSDYGAVIDSSRKAADRLNKGVTGLMKKNKIEVFMGRGSLLGGGKVKVDGDNAATLEGRNVLVATGSTELILPGVNVDGQRVLTSREALECKTLPKSIVVVGAGAVGLEFAYSYACYGTEVTVIEMADQALPGFDSDIANTLTQSFNRRGVKIRTKTAYRSLDVDGSGVVVTVESEKGEEEIRADQILFGIGRKALVDNMGLAEAGVAVENGFIKVGPDLKTSAPGVWAIGDVVGPPLLAHKASEEGIAAVEFMAGKRTQPVDYNLVPGCIYCQPQVATVGMTEAQARDAGHEVKIGKIPFVASGKAVGTGHTEGFVKLVADARYGEILGCQIIGAEATELIGEVAMAMVLESTIHELGEACHAHPTLSEMIKEAALDAAGRAINF
jgi:dihydrolipoamide dehydrogenase